MGIPAGLAIFLTLFCIQKTIKSFPHTLLLGLFGISGYSFMSQTGTGTNEMQTTCLVLGGVAAFLQFRENATRASVICGLLLGVAAGLKLTAMIYTVPLLAGMLFFYPTWREKIYVFLFFCSAWWLAFGILYGYWGWHLWRETGNPFFPIFNNLFHSSLIPQINLDYDFENFRPKSLREKLFYPFYWISGSRVTDGLTTTDDRFLFAESLAGITVIFALFSRCFVRRVAISRGNDGSVSTVYFSKAGNTPFAVQNRLFLFFFVFIVLSFGIWEIGFSAFRYVIPMESLLGLFCFLCLTSIFRSRDGKDFKLNINSPVCLLATSALLFFLLLSVATDEGAESYRGKFSNSFVEADVPKLPKGSLVILAPGSSFLAPIFVRENPIVSFVGGLDYLITNPKLDNSEMKEKIAQRISSHQGDIFLLVQTRTFSGIKKFFPIYSVAPASAPPENIATNYGGYLLFQMERQLP
jgi:hypothetical protein